MIQPPVRQFVVKVTNACNLACDRCYFLNRGGVARESRPTNMSWEIFAGFVAALGDYVRGSGPPLVHVIFHGGEPLLRPRQFFRDAVALLRSEIPPRCQLRLSLQTNATRMTPDFARILAECGIHWAASVDGPALVHDRVRRYHDGRGSHGDVWANLRALPPDRPFGILAVVDGQSDPSMVFESLLALNPVSLDFLLPDGTHDSPPPGVDPARFDRQDDYGVWLARGFDLWYPHRHSMPPVRIFTNMLALIDDPDALIHWVGARMLNCLTIQTDGEICDDDTLAAAGPGLSRFGEGWHVGEGCFQYLQQSPDFLRHSRRWLPMALAAPCRACPSVDVCCGGNLPHRWGKAHCFDAPSIHCGSLRHLVEHARRRHGKG